MRKVILTSFMMVFCVILSAQKYNLTGIIGKKNASIIIKKDGNSVNGTFIPCPIECIPIVVEGTWKDNIISLYGSSKAGSQVSLTLKVDGNIVKGKESLWVEGKKETAKFSMKMTQVIEPPSHPMDAAFKDDTDYWREKDAYYQQEATKEGESATSIETVSTDSIEAARKAERQKAIDNLKLKYGKNYVDALFNEGKILIGTPEGLVRDHTNSELISETQYTRTYKISGYFRDWASTVRVDVNTRKVISVRNWTY